MKTLLRLLLGLLATPFALHAQTAPAQLSNFIGYLTGAPLINSQGRQIALYDGATVTRIYGELRVAGAPSSYVGAQPPKAYTYAATDATHGLLTIEGETAQVLTFTSPTRAVYSDPRTMIEFRQRVPREEMTNTSARVAIGAGKSAIVGFVVDGTRARWVLIRAVGPGLQAYGVTGTLADPKLAVFGSTGVTFGSAGSWRTSEIAQSVFVAVTNLVGAFPLQTTSDDAVLFLFLPPGVYSAYTSSASGTGSGEVMTEVYVLP